MSPILRRVIYIVILALVILMAWLGAPKKNYQPRGVLLPTGVYRPAIPTQNVTVIEQPTVQGTLIGTIHVEAYAKDNIKQVVKYTVNKASVLSAKYGANQVNILGVYRDPSDKTVHLYAQAYAH